MLCGIYTCVICYRESYRETLNDKKYTRVELLSIMNSQCGLRCKRDTFLISQTTLVFNVSTFNKCIERFNIFDIYSILLVVIKRNN